MAKPSSPSAVRPPRSDARRNRERLLEVARRAFGEYGPDATLDEVARRAGVGPGTLYRHFPSRDALIEAVFRKQVEKLIAAGDKYMDEMEPLDALQAWMLKFIDYVVDKLLILPAMDAVPGGSARLIDGTRGVLHEMFRKLVKRAVKSGQLRAGTEPDDLYRAFVGVLKTASLPGWEASARRIVRILIDGSRKRK